jgi:hypothetical protein
MHQLHEFHGVTELPPRSWVLATDSLVEVLRDVASFYHYTNIVRSVLGCGTHVVWYLVRHKADTIL